MGGTSPPPQIWPRTPAPFPCYCQPTRLCWQGFMAGPTKPEQDPGKEPPGPGRALADAMLRDIGVTYQARERQLAGAARTLRRRLRGLLRRHEELLVAYRWDGGEGGSPPALPPPPGLSPDPSPGHAAPPGERARPTPGPRPPRPLPSSPRGSPGRMQREQILAHGDSLVEPGPPEAHFAGGAGDRQRPASARELGRPREDRARLEARLRELQAVRSGVRGRGPARGRSRSPSLPPSPEDEEHWAELRQQLRDFTRTTQSQLERERSRLLSRALLAEERLAELQDYVDRHLAR
ncbi:coiled-coil domain-containing protein 78 [Ornithorhynchus anatinus]|uniref:coiled-coil domain-containing protein 78 n=1 Tax=Ornithorhynchus anatinus TaxID=9258 RepID=UPI0019D46397|nr:coiled-coil domain-containing protein 78 [Ornithorhynchus anatinus]